MPNRYTERNRRSLPGWCLRVCDEEGGRARQEAIAGPMHGARLRWARGPMYALIAAPGAFPARPGGCRPYPGVRENVEEAQTPAARGRTPATPARFLCGFLCRLAHASKPRQFWPGIAPTACKKVCKSMQIYAVLCRGEIAQKVSKTETSRRKWQTRRTAWNCPGRADFERRAENGGVVSGGASLSQGENRR
jgi:hypothetical protein